MAKRERILSEKVQGLDTFNRLRSILGKAVFSKSGEPVGKVIDVLTDNTRYVGVLIKSNGTIFVDKEYIKNDTQDSIILSIEPITQMIGKQVIDSEGRRLGKVMDISRSSTKNDYTAIIVKKSIISRKVSIPKKEVDVARKNIILNTAYDIRPEYNTKI